MKPQASRLKPEASRMNPEGSGMNPEASRLKPQASRLKPKAVDLASFPVEAGSARDRRSPGPEQPPSERRDRGGLHATQHGDLQYVLRAHVAPGYRGAVDLLTRQGETSDFASDACIYKEGVDPSTGTRYLEEMAFEVVSEQSPRDVTEKAVEMHRRGVRRIFAVFVKGPRVSEWSPESRSWRPLEAGSWIEDRCLVAPLAVAALLDTTLADNAVAEALIAKGNPSLLKREAAAQARGKAEGRAEVMAESILKVLEARGVAVSQAQRDTILHCSDVDRLDRWWRRVSMASSAEELTSEF